ncbi:hypothetical protein JCM19235_1363 [Vibrio maritimus]|uniref:Uncharacterized protein n=1 Tax=Vibrio maritimus TaxID=990268 RepID=A0A090SUQ9_9VIBR|nr:hypothetical protein JCM19235_1363 [Vibrio maritimus]
MTDNNRALMLGDIPPVHQLIDKGLDTAKAKGLSLNEIARMCGMIKPNSKSASPIFSMLRRGTMRLPLDRVIAVADNLNIDRRLLLISQLRDSLQLTIVKTDSPSEKAEFERVWKAVSAILMYTHTESEALLVNAIREVEQELDQKIEPDEETIGQFKELLRDQYAL